MIHDTLIIGAGPAGLQTALGLARQLYSVVVFDSQQYRNSPADHMHNVLTWDHKAPNEFRTSAQANLLARYRTVSIRNSRINNIAKSEDNTFEAVDDLGTKFVGKTVVLATGVSDVLPDIDGFKELWGKSIFHCLFCHGYEEAGGPSAGLIATRHQPSPQVLHASGMAASLAKNVVVYTNGDDSVTESMTAATKNRRITIEGKKIMSISRKQAGRSDVVVHLEDGSTRTEAFMVSLPPTKLNGPLVDQLGLEVTDSGIIKTSQPFYETSVRRVFAVGDCATPMKSVTVALSTGTFAAAGVAGQLGQEKF